MQQNSAYSLEIKWIGVCVCVCVCVHVDEAGGLEVTILRVKLI